MSSAAFDTWAASVAISPEHALAAPTDAPADGARGGEDDDYEWETPLAVQKAVNAYHMHGDAIRLNALDKAIREALAASRAAGRKEREGEIAATTDTEPVDKYAVGLYAKFRVERTDGRSAPGQKHDGCRYFVLDLTHDPHAPAAMRAYIESCRAEYPLLAADLEPFTGPSDGK
jgi:hypothetical protein